MLGWVVTSSGPRGGRVLVGSEGTRVEVSYTDGANRWGRECWRRVWEAGKGSCQSGGAKGAVGCVGAGEEE